jgi:hypothetical protein
MKNIKTHKGTKRDEQVAQGVYDGRYKQKVIKDKKKEYNKYICRIKNQEL